MSARTQQPLAAEYRSTATPQQVASRLSAARRVLLTTHVKPDGDGMGAALALWRVLKARGAQPEIFLVGPLEPRLREIAGDTPFEVSDGRPPKGDHDLIVVLDTGAWTQLETIAQWLRDRRDRVVGIDHHVKGDDVAPMRLVDATAASTTQVLVPILDAMGAELTGGPGGVAEALFVGLATDTGWFRYSSADARALRTGARLLELGVDKSRLYQTIEETFQPARLSLLGRALASLEFARNGTVAIMRLRPEDFRQTGGSVEDISELVNTPMSVRSVRVSILLAQTSPKGTKLSFRSKPDAPGGVVDVNLLAQRFGGGGHMHAAGASLNQDIDAARAALLEVIEDLG
jgi:phosphoesterase RecJ-like protein